MIKKVALFAVLALAAPIISACTTADIQANEAKAQQIIAAIKAGVTVTVSGLREGVDAVCSNQEAVASAAIVTQQILSTQSGPQTTQNLNNLNTALATLNSVCSQAAANPGDSNLKVLLKQAWAAYQTVKAQTAATQGS